MAKCDRGREAVNGVLRMEDSLLWGAARMQSREVHVCGYLCSWPFAPIVS